MSKLETSLDHRPDPKQTFLRYLPERVATIADDWRTIADQGWNATKLEPILQRVQDLSSVADKFGLTEIHDGLLPLTQCFYTLSNTQKSPSEHQVEQIDSLLRRISTISQKKDVPDEKIAQTARKQNSAIYYLCGKQTLAPGLSSALDGYQYSLSQFEDIDALVNAIARKPPAAIIANANILPQDGILDKQDNIIPLLIILSETGDLDVRLQALKAGAKAYFVVPIDAQRVAAKLHQLLNAAPEQPHRILVMDDDPPQASFAMAILRKSGLDVRAVTNPEDVLEAIEEFCPDLVLMDVYMPKIDGLQLTRIIREQTEFADLPIVFMSGEQDVEKQLEALNSGGDGFVTKPIRVHYLRTIINSRITRSRTSQYQTIDTNDRDTTTGLYNRRGLFTRINKLLANGARALVHGLICLEIDNLDSIKQAIGFKQNEALLAAVSTQILSQITPQDLCARIDDNRFAILATRTQQQELMQLGETLVLSITRRSYPIDGLNTELVIISGMSVFQPAPTDSMTIEQQAISACHLSRNESGMVIYDATNMNATNTNTNTNTNNSNSSSSSSSMHITSETVPPSSQTSVAPDITQILRQALQKNSFAVSWQDYVAPQKSPLNIQELNLSLPINSNRALTTQSINTFAQQLGLSKEVDQLLIRIALDKLQKNLQSGQNILILLNQSAETLIEPAYTNWLQGELQKRGLKNNGLILSWNLLDLVNNIKGAYALVKALNIMGIATCLTRFSQNEASYKVLNYLQHPYIKLSEKMLEMESEAIDVMLQRIKKSAAKIIIPKIPKSHTINRNWLTKADLIPKDMS